MIQVSTGYKTMILGPHAFTDIFDFGAIHVYDGVRPATADDPVTSNRIGTITSGGLPWTPAAHGNGLKFLQSGPYIISEPWSNWVLFAEITARATWARLVSTQEDIGTLSYELPRIDMDVSDLTGDSPELFLPDADIVQGKSIVIYDFFYSIPPFV